MSGQRRYRCWIPPFEGEGDGAIIWRKHAGSAAAEHAAARWQETGGLGPYEVHTRNAQREESIFVTTIDVTTAILPGGSCGKQLRTVTRLKKGVLET